MSGVTIGELVEDFMTHTETGNKITQVEIVPRAIVEEIIKLCKEGENEAKDEFAKAIKEITRTRAGEKCRVFKRIREYAEEALEKFEKGGADNG